MIRHYIWNLLIALDQLANTMLGGDPDETFSSRAARGSRSGSRSWGMVCRLLHWFEPGHCEKSIELDEGANETVSRPWGLLLLWIIVLMLWLGSKAAMAATPANTQPSYDAWRFWLDMFQVVWMVASALVFWWVAKTRANNKSINELRDSAGDMDARMRVVEAEIERLPNHSDMGKLHEKINKVSVGMEGIRGELTGVNNTLHLIHASLLGERN